MKKSSVTRSLLAAVSVVALSAVMYGCVHNGGSDDPPPVVEPEPEPTAYEAGKAAIMAATTAAAAQAAYDAVDQSAISGAEAASLTVALNTRLAAIATAMRVADQRMALADAAGMIDTSDLSTQALVDAARAGIVALRAALAAAADMSDADKAMYMSTLDDAVDAVDMAQGGIDTATRRTNQMSALSSASMTLQSALAALSGSTPTQAQLDAANAARTALSDAIMDGADLTDAENAGYVREAANAAPRIDMAQTAFNVAMDAAQAARDKAMQETARKMHASIGPEAYLRYPGFSPSTGAHNIPNRDDVLAFSWRQRLLSPASGFRVNLGARSDSDVFDFSTATDGKQSKIASNYGWEGIRHKGKMVGEDLDIFTYRNESGPPEGKKFSTQYSANFSNGTLNETTTEGTASRVASPSFDHSAGWKTFKLPENTIAVMIPGTYHGVSGTYSCVPGDGNTCAANVAASGFTLGGVNAQNQFSAGNSTWTFKPADPMARVVNMPTEEGTFKISYGWWMRKHNSTNALRPNVLPVGSVSYGPLLAIRNSDASIGVSNVTALRGKATYTGGAVGVYAISSGTGGMNDAGHFSAKATLEADFNDDTVTGTIDNFMVGMLDKPASEARNFSVELKEAAIENNGTIGRQSTAATVWTIDGKAAAASDRWRGYLVDTGDDGVPKTGAGWFSSAYGKDGRMVGAFGVDKQ